MSRESIRDRIKELRRVRAGDLCAHPGNWREHPAAQREALRGILAEVGYAGALIARELPDGRLQLIDGHLRAELDREQVVPVLVLDVDETEAEKLLAALDPLAAMAIANDALLCDLLTNVHSDDEALQALFDDLRSGAAGDVPETPGADAASQIVPDMWRIVVDCAGEDDQRALYEQLLAAGRKCRLLVS